MSKLANDHMNDVTNSAIKDCTNLDRIHWKESYPCQLTGEGLRLEIYSSDDAL
jgi:hypothetical protein